jgi:hypothetical protein
MYRIVIVLVLITDPKRIIIHLAAYLAPSVKFLCRFKIFSSAYTVLYHVVGLTFELMMPLVAAYLIPVLFYTGKY